MADDAEEAEENEWPAKQFEAFAYSGGSVGFFFINGSGRQQSDGEEADDGIYHKQCPPAKAEGGEQRCCSPGGYYRSEERCYCLYELPEGERGGKFVAADKIGDKWIQRGLHYGVADAEQRKRNQHHHVAVAESGDEQGGCRDDKADENCFFTPDAVHQNARRNGKNQEPEEHQRGEKISLGVGEIQIFLNIV